MKKFFCFLAAASTMLLASCGGSDDSSSNPSTDDNGGGTPGATSIVVTSNGTSKLVGEQFTFTVKNNLGADVTASSTFSVEGVTVTNPTSFENAGQYKVVAKNGELVSAELVLTVTAPAGGGDEGDGEVRGKYTFNGTDYAVNHMRFNVHRSGSTGGASLINLAAEGQEPIVRSFWRGVIYNGYADNAMEATNYMEYYFFLPVQEQQDGYYLIFPADAGAVPEAYDVYADNNQIPFELPEDMNSADIIFNTFVIGETTASSDNSSTWGVNGSVVLSHEFNGELAGVSYLNMSTMLQRRSARVSNVKASSTVRTSEVKKFISKSSAQIISLKDLKK